MVHSLTDEAKAVFERYRGAVVKIEASDKNGLLCGTGFFIDPNGTLITSYSVGGETGEVVVVQGETKLPAHRLAGDSRSGCAILKLDRVTAPTPFVPMANPSNLTVATPVMSIAYPMDMPVTAETGMVAGFSSKFQDRYFAVTHIRAGVPVHRGEGGAPLLNMHGEAVGVVISGIDGGASCFALPIEAAEKLRRDYVRYGAMHPGRLGVMLREAIRAVQGSTVEVLRVEEDAPAMKAGIQKGDVVLRIGRNAIRAPEDVQNAAFYLTAGEKVPVTVSRDGNCVTIDVEPAEPSVRKSVLQGLHAYVPKNGEDITLRPDGR